ncbi:MAG: cation:proton antiporter [Candidatus Micrarchaeota archaeon]
MPIQKLRAAHKHMYPLAAFLFIALVILLFLSVIRASLFTPLEEEKKIWFEVSFLLFAAILAEFLIVYIKQPFVMSLLLLGVVLSPSFIDLAWPAISQTISSISANSVFPISLPATPPSILAHNIAVLKTLAQFGAIILLFKIGLHSEVRQIFTFKNFVVALLGILVPFVCGYWFGELSGYSSAASLFFGAALTATSVGVTVAILAEFKLLERDFAKLLLGAAVIDDILALLVLSFVSSSQALSLSSLAPLLQISLTALIFIVGGILLGRFIAENYVEAREKQISNRTFLGVMALMLTYAYVAEFIGLSAIVGAFIAGVTLNYSRFASRLAETIFPLEALFTPIFFITLGMMVDVAALGPFLVPILLVTILALLTKLIGCGLAARLLGSSLNESVVVGIGMVPRGEIALIIALYGLTTGILGAAEYTIITSMAFLTTLVTPPLLQKTVNYVLVHNSPRFSS